MDSFQSVSDDLFQKVMTQLKRFVYALHANAYNYVIKALKSGIFACDQNKYSSKEIWSLNIPVN